MKSITKITTVAFLGVLIMNLASVQAASEITGTLSTSVGATESGTLAGTVTGGSPASNPSAASSGGGSGLGFGGYGGGGGIAYVGSAPSQEMASQYYSQPGIAYDDSMNEYLSSAGSSGDNSGLAYSSYPDVPYAGGQPGNTPGNTNLVAAAASVGGLSTAAAIAVVLIGAGALGGAAYGLNHVYRRRRGL